MKRLALIIGLALYTAGLSFAGEDPYGLLFTSPGQRAQLDNRFAGNPVETQTGIATGTVTAHAPRLLELNGTLISDTGRKEVWINGESQLQTNAAQTGRIHLLGSNRVQVRLSPSGMPRNLKPGQVLNPETGSITEAYAKAALPEIPQETAGAQK